MTYSQELIELCSLDGTTVVDSLDQLACETINAERSRVVKEVFDTSTRETQKEVFSRRGESLVFDLEPGPEWRGGSRTYDSEDLARAGFKSVMDFTDGGTFTISMAAWAGGATRCDGIITAADGTPEVSIRATAKALSRSEYDAAKGKLEEELCREVMHASHRRFTNTFIMNGSITLATKM